MYAPVERGARPRIDARLGPRRERQVSAHAVEYCRPQGLAEDVGIAGGAPGPDLPSAGRGQTRPVPRADAGARTFKQLGSSLIATHPSADATAFTAVSICVVRGACRVFTTAAAGARSGQRARHGGPERM